MDSSHCWIYLWTVFLLVSGGPEERYTVHLEPASFDRALQKCSPGVLTTLSTAQEAADILQLVSGVLPNYYNNFTFWVGLRKSKNECVVPERPLKGFKWTTNGSQESEVDRWRMEPEATCTALRCAVLSGEFDGSTVTSWGFISGTCKVSYPFICKRDRQAGEGDSRPLPPEPEPKPKPKPEPEAKPTRESTPEPDPELEPTPESKSEPKPEPGPKPEPEPHPRPRPDTGSDPCHMPHIKEVRSFTCTSLLGGNNVQVDCWSGVRLQLFCSGSPVACHLNGSAVDLNDVCLPCQDGYQRDAAWRCVDVDECGNSPCRHSCVNTPGSYLCVCYDRDGNNHSESSAVCIESLPPSPSPGPGEGEDRSTSRILIPGLVAVLVLVLLLVLLGVVVKCCLMRRSKKRAMKKAEKLAMESKDGGRDSLETTNEKKAT
ncbi:C-type lectin domain family 14 member A [Myripristis murdjan]|uniref:C-type lectin domain family 14 member A n=1 Tax=Myripristis murdjan TaxID=586833 RepID=UPI0011763835|nr:complement component C1q receptor-like [Myripristis murdjan]